jgi:hypothetical protein
MRVLWSDIIKIMQDFTEASLIPWTRAWLFPQCRVRLLRFIAEQLTLSGIATARVID